MFRLLCSIKNTSAGDNAAWSYKIKVYAENNLGDFAVLYTTEGKIPAIGETSDLISFNSWDAVLSGTYNVIADIEGYDDYYICTLAAREAPSVNVTSNTDEVNGYDGLTTLREAVSYAAESGEAVTVGNDIGTISLRGPIDIDSGITIKALPIFEDADCPVIVSDNKTRVFNISENGSLTLYSLGVGYGTSVDYGGAIKNDGGRLIAEDCLFHDSKSGFSGGAIYSDGGEITLKNCSIYGNTAGYGGAIGIDGGAVVNALNCGFVRNNSNSGAVYVNGGEFTAVYSTFTENSAASSGGGAVASNGKASLIGCILSGNKFLDVSGNARLYGCCYGMLDIGVEADELSSEHGAYDIFVLNMEEQSQWTMNGALHYTPLLSTLVNEGVYVKNNNGMIGISADNSEWIDIGISSPFTNEEYSLDCTGAEHGRLFGSYNSFADYCTICGADTYRVMIYSPEETEAELIISYSDYEENLTGVTLIPVKLEPGTNTIYLSDETDGIPKYMLWRSLDSMAPLCETY